MFPKEFYMLILTVTRLLVGAWRTEYWLRLRFVQFMGVTLLKVSVWQSKSTKQNIFQNRLRDRVLRWDYGTAVEQRLTKLYKPFSFRSAMYYQSRKVMFRSFCAIRWWSMWFSHKAEPSFAIRTGAQSSSWTDVTSVLYWYAHRVIWTVPTNIDWCRRGHNVGFSDPKRHLDQNLQSLVH